VRATGTALLGISPQKAYIRRMFSAASRLGGVAALCVLVVAVAGCGGGTSTHGSSVLAASRSGWTGGTQLGKHGVLGACATATGSHHRLLIVCRSASTAAFSKTCWSAPDQESIAEGGWEDASTDPACTAAQSAAEHAGLFRH